MNESNPHVPNPQEPPPRRTILLVDDFPDIRTVITLSFEQFGFRVVSVGDGASALAMCESNQIDIAVIDYGLPDVDGIELGARIRQLPAEKPFPLVLFSGRINSELEARAKEVGFAAYVLKPVRMEKLMEIIQSILNDSPNSSHWLSSNRSP